MLALITGATGGIGCAFARLLAAQGYDLILASRNTKKMRAMQHRLPTKVQIVTVDLSKEADCHRLYDMVQAQKIDLLINNAGFGVYGAFSDTALEEELNMLAVNVQAVHILTKLFLQDFIQRDYGYILNVASSAGFLAGPLMASYYAGKSYVLRLTEGIAQELKESGSRVRVAALCPGPVNTAFHQRANIHQAIKGISPQCAAVEGLRGLFAGKTIILPDLQTKAARFGQRFLPERMLLWVLYRIQKAKAQKQ